MDLFIAQTVPTTQAEGPGERFAVWVQGCSLRCPGCCNPEFFRFGGGTSVTPVELATQVLQTKGVEGVSILGGEPFDQAAALAEFVRAVKQAGLSVMIYSGYRLEELKARKDQATQHLLGLTDLLVDGRYERSMPESQRRWVGSTNQQMHFLTERYSPLDQQFWEDNTVEIRFDGSTITVNGWPIGATVLQPTA